MRACACRAAITNMRGVKRFLARGRLEPPHSVPDAATAAAWLKVPLPAPRPLLLQFPGPTISSPGQTHNTKPNICTCTAREPISVLLKAQLTGWHVQCDRWRRGWSCRGSSGRASRGCGGASTSAASASWPCASPSMTPSPPPCPTASWAATSPATSSRRAPARPPQPFAGQVSCLWQ